MASGQMAPSNAKSGRNVDLTLRPDSRLAFRRQVRQTHGTHGTQGIIFADVLSYKQAQKPTKCQSAFTIACIYIFVSTRYIERYVVTTGLSRG